MSPIFPTISRESILLIRGSRIFRYITKIFSWKTLRRTRSHLSRISILVLLAFFTITPVTAANAAGDCVVDNFTDVTGSNSDGSRTFRFCMSDETGAAEEFGAVTFDHGDSPKTIELTNATVSRSSTVTIDGEDFVTITLPDGQSFPMISTLAELEIIDMKFEGGNASQGGAIYHGGSALISISSSEFTNNSSILAERADSSLAYGGGAITTTGPLYIDSTIFDSNSSILDGGAILASSVLSVSRSIFTNNTAGAEGGAVWTDSDGEFTQNSFVSNTAATNGGAVYADSDSAFEKNYFAFNKADFDDNGSGNGGAVYENKHIKIANSSFYKNSAVNGGAVYNFNSDATHEGYFVYSTLIDNTATTEGPSLYWRNGQLDLMGSIFVGSQDKQQVVLGTGSGTSVDHGGNISSFSTSTVIDNSSSKTDVSLTSLGVTTPATATLSSRPTVPFSYRSTAEFAVTDSVINSFNTATVGQVDADAPSDDQSGTTRTTPFTSGAEFLAIAQTQSVTPAPYSGPIITDIGEDNISAPFQTFSGQQVRVDGERLSTVSMVFVDNQAGEVLSASDDHFLMTFPFGIEPGTYDLVISSAIGNLTYLDGFFFSSTGGSTGDGNQAANAACEGVETSYWTQRISDTQAKAYLKCPEVGKKYRILQQTGGSGEYTSILAKTLTDENDTTQVFNEFGRYIVRTIDLEAINRIRIRVDDVELWKVRYNNPSGND